MNTNILYDIYTINHQTPGEDLTVSMAKFQAQLPGVLPHEAVSHTHLTLPTMEAV